MNKTDDVGKKHDEREKPKGVEMEKDPSGNRIYV